MEGESGLAFAEQAMEMLEKATQEGSIAAADLISLHLERMTEITNRMRVLDALQNVPVPLKS